MSVFYHCIEHDNEFSHGSDYGEFEGLAIGSQALEASNATTAFAGRRAMSSLTPCTVLGRMKYVPLG
ncbi:MAG: hypothetical protein PVF65_11875, partial [Sphingomonadales bacterium]